ncbi:class I SAM-dependent methyltransferase [uncultured Shewanella sp.]|uniref:class I SAM-dependent methyltransferase n=1 Tax=uncultured Shewanella sp. TaxID=173975 RepID=UPI002602838D|nr:class I SAM-dependent methyltransferase [uncultured Shewanella sp.]
MDSKVRHDKWRAQEYASVSDMQWRQAMEALRRCDYSESDAILDVGSGDGKITRYVAEHLSHGKVIGIDLVKDMVRFAQTHHADQANLSFLQMSADEIAFDQRFDIILSFSCLHWVAAQAKIWHDFYQHLTSKGKVVCGFQVDHQHFWDTVFEHQQAPQWQSYFLNFQDPYHHFTLTEMVGFIEEAGFYLPRVDEIHHVEYFETQDNLTAFFQSWVPQFRHLGSSVRGEFVKQVMESYMSKIHYKMRERAGVRIKRYIIEAEK